MSRSTPRKQRHQQHPSISQTHGHARNRSQHLSAQIPNASDYESDTAYYMEQHPAPPVTVLASRTNTELNLSVLQRYLPNITHILSIAANAVVYTFAAGAKWEKAGIEGTMFVCAQHSPDLPDGGIGNGCVFILNRHGLNNLVLQLDAVEHFEVSPELLMFKLVDRPGPAAAAETDDEDSGAAAGPKVLGLWIHADEEQTRTINAEVIRELWEETKELKEMRAQRAAAAGHGYSSAAAAAGGIDVPVGPAMQAIGRKVSLSDLFGAKNGAGGGH